MSSPPIQGDAAGRLLELVSTPTSLAAMVEVLRASPVGAIDTEANGMYAYHERICLVQVSTPERDWVIDPMAVDPRPLDAWLADPACVKVMHAADNDIRALRRDWDLRLVNVFDTMMAARALAWPAKGLGDILGTYFDCKTDKRWQRYDWARRPLTAEALQYARNDTRYLPALRDLQRPLLAEVDRLEEVQHACDRLTRLEPRPRVFDGDAWARIDGVRTLDDPGRAALEALCRLRETLAAKLDRAPYRVLGEAVLVELARRRPTTRAELVDVRGVGGPIAHRHAGDVLACIAEAVAATEPPPWPTRPPRPERKLAARIEALGRWRREHAATRGLEPDIVLPKDCLTALAHADPTDLAEVVATGALDEWELERHGEALLEVLARARA